MIRCVYNDGDGICNCECGATHCPTKAKTAADGDHFSGLLSFSLHFHIAHNEHGKISGEPQLTAILRRSS